MHHTNVIAAMISSSVGICDRGGGHAPGGRGRQRAPMSAVGCAVGCTAFEEEPFAEVCDTVAESLVNGDMVEEWQREEGAGAGTTVL